MSIETPEPAPLVDTIHERYLLREKGRALATETIAELTSEGDPLTLEQVDIQLTAADGVYQRLVKAAEVAYGERERWLSEQARLSVEQEQKNRSKESGS